MILHHLNQKLSRGGSPEHPSPKCDITYTFYKTKTHLECVLPGENTAGCHIYNNHCL